MFAALEEKADADFTTRQLEKKASLIDVEMRLEQKASIADVQVFLTPPFVPPHPS